MAAELGADFVATTLSGYTPGAVHQAGDGRPDFDLIRALQTKIKTPIIGEGRIWHDRVAAQTLEAGAYSVCVGSAITRPQLITRRFVEALQRIK